MPRRYTWLGLLVMLVALSTVSAPAVHAAEPFTDPEGRFSFTPPDNYEPLTAQEIRQAVRAGSAALGIAGSSDALVVALSNPTTMANVNVAAISLRGAVTNVGEGAEQLTRVLGNVEGVTLDSAGIETLTIGGEDARTYGYTLSLGGVEARGQQFLVIRGDVAYFITFTALTDDFDAFFEETRIILETFAFLT